MKSIQAVILPAVALALSVLSPQTAFAGKPASSPGGSGVVVITQDKADTGGITPGDDPGFPITISETGSYRLESNLTLPDTSTMGLYITADNVTVDLNGFTIAKPNFCNVGGPCNTIGGSDGIVGTYNISVFGGTITGMGGNGISLGRNARVERVHVRHSGMNGILTGEAGLVSDSVIELSYFYGVRVGSGSLVLRNVIGLNPSGVRFNFALGSGGLGLNSFVDNVNGPITGSPTILQPNACIGSGC